MGSIHHYRISPNTRNPFKITGKQGYGPSGRSWDTDELEYLKVDYRENHVLYSTQDASQNGLLPAGYQLPPECSLARSIETNFNESWTRICDEDGEDLPYYYISLKDVAIEELVNKVCQNLHRFFHSNLRVVGHFGRYGTHRRVVSRLARRRERH